MMRFSILRNGFVFQPLARSAFDGAAPSPRRLATLRRGIKAAARAAFSGSRNTHPLWRRARWAGRATGVLDPLGWDLEAGWSLYPTLLQKLATNLRQCLE